MGKTVENRTGEPPAGTQGTEIVVHAGQTWDQAGTALAAPLGITGFDNPRHCPTGYLGTVRLTGVHPATRCCTPWGQPEPGTNHWELADPSLFDKPVPGEGRLGLWWLPLN